MLRFLLTFFLAFCLYNNSYCQPADTLQDIPLDEKIGAMLLVGFRGTSVTDTNHIVRDITEHHLGGVILFDYDVPSSSPVRNVESPKQLKTLTQNIQALADDSLIISIDQEGGQVARLKPKLGFPHTVSAQYLGTTNDTDTTQYYARQTAEMLNKLGINMNFAPVVDLNVNPNNPVIGQLERSFSADPATVTKHASTYIQTLKDHHILSVIKHFPGHGSSKKDSHLGVVDVTKTWSKKELIPYRNLIQNDMVDAIMTAHIFNRKIDPDYPATLSKPTINGLLRNKLGYDGVVISDDLMMGAIRNEYGLKTTIEKAINAGVDILTFANNSVYNPNIVPEAHKIIKELLEEGTISQQQINTSYQRIMELKTK